MERAREAARGALERAQRRQAEQYGKKKAREGAPFRVGDQVWCCKPSHGTDVSKLRHSQRGPAMIVEDLGFDNVLVHEMEDGQEYVCHVSRFTSYRSSERVRNELIGEWARCDRLNDKPKREGQRTDAIGNV